MIVSKSILLTVLIDVANTSYIKFPYSNIYNNMVLKTKVKDQNFTEKMNNEIAQVSCADIMLVSSFCYFLL